MAKNLEMTLLYDFFGELLSDRQKEYFDLYYNDDLSLSEIADMMGISRQGVKDVLGRAEAALQEFESKTGVVSRFVGMRATVAGLEAAAEEFLESAADEHTAQLASAIVSGLKKLEL